MARSNKEMTCCPTTCCNLSDVEVDQLEVLSVVQSIYVPASRWDKTIWMESNNFKTFGGTVVIQKIGLGLSNSPLRDSFFCWSMTWSSEWIMSLQASYDFCNAHPIYLGDAKSVNYRLLLCLGAQGMWIQCVPGSSVVGCSRIKSPPRHRDMTSSYISAGALAAS